MHTNIENELQLLPKENNLTSEQGYIYIEKPKTPEPVKKSKRLPFAKQTEKLGGVPYQTNNNRKTHTKNRSLLQEKTTTTTSTKRNEKENHRRIRKDDEEI